MREDTTKRGVTARLLSSWGTGVWRDHPSSKHGVARTNDDPPSFSSVLHELRRLSSCQASGSNEAELDAGEERRTDKKRESGAVKTDRALRELGVTNAKIRELRATTSASSTSSRLGATPPRPPPRRRRRRRQPDPPDGERLRWLHEQDHRNVFGSGDGGGPVTARLRVKSVHAAQTIDFVAVLSKVFGGGGMSGPGALSRLLGMAGGRPIRHIFGRTSVMVQLPPPTPLPPPMIKAPAMLKKEEDGSRMLGRITPFRRAQPKVGDSGSTYGHQSHLFNMHTASRFVAVFRFGSVVFFNVSPREVGKILEEIKKHSTDPISSGFERKEHFEVAIQPGMEGTARVNGDFALVRELDMMTCSVISTIMAQTVALDSYSDTVDELLANFASINSTVKKTGNFTDMEKDGLFKVVAQNNSIFIDMIGKLGIKDRSDTAWNLSQYENVHEGMKDEFEIESRFEHIEFKLDLIQQNAKFFVEVLESQKSNKLEWIIIVLISFECVLMVLEMSGMGTAMFATIPFDILRP